MNQFVVNFLNLDEMWNLKVLVWVLVLIVEVIFVNVFGDVGEG